MIEVDNPACKIPAGAIPITREQRQALLDGQSQGRIITEDANGFPILTDPPPPSAEQLAVVQRGWRNSELLASDPAVTRHRDERDLGRTTTLTDEQFAQLLDYRQLLRDWPATADFPSEDHRPDKPAWLDQSTL